MASTKRQLELQAAKARIMHRAKIETLAEKIKADQRKVKQMRLDLRGMR